MATSNPIRDFAPHQVRRDSSFGGGFLIAAVATLALGVGIGVAVFFWRSSPRDAASDAVAAAVASATAPRATPMETPPLEIDDGTWTDADLRRCGNEAGAASDAASKRKLAAVSADRVGLGGPDPKMVERSAFLLCSVSAKPLHLCHGYWHNKLVEAVSTYATEFHNVSSSAYWTKVTLAEQVRANAATNHAELQALADDLDQTTRDVAKMHEEITAALRALVADGILEKREFAKFLGYGVPPNINALLGDGKAVRHVCG
jgi:hypothetical protein